MTIEHDENIENYTNVQDNSNKKIRKWKFNVEWMFSSCTVVLTELGFSIFLSVATKNPPVSSSWGTQRKQRSTIEEIR